eukprot:14059362-Alexandrium_andersonii.AAC.1
MATSTACSFGSAPALPPFFGHAASLDQCPYCPHALQGDSDINFLSRAFRSSGSRAIGPVLE